MSTEICNFIICRDMTYVVCTLSIGYQDYALRSRKIRRIAHEGGMALALTYREKGIALATCFVLVAVEQLAIFAVPVNGIASTGATTVPPRSSRRRPRTKTRWSENVYGANRSQCESEFVTFIMMTPANRMFGLRVKLSDQTAASIFRPIPPSVAPIFGIAAQDAAGRPFSDGAGRARRAAVALALHHRSSAEI